MILLILLLLTLAPCFATASLGANLVSGFVPGDLPGSFWAGGPGYRARVDASGLELVRGTQRVRFRFSGQTQWEQVDSSGPRVTRLGPAGRNSIATRTVRARSVRPGLDVWLYAGNTIKIEFALSAGTAPGHSLYCVDGAEVRVADQGQSLRFDAGEGWSWTESGLSVWQVETDGTRVPRQSEFRVEGSCVRFQVGHLDPSLPTWIDPDLVFSTYLGGGLFDVVNAVATDASGNTYWGGWTESWDFPVSGAMQAASRGRIDGFLAKLNPSGQLLWATYIGGSGEDRVQAISLDSAGNIHLVGSTGSADFPTASAARPSLAGGRDAFAMKLSPSGNQILYSTYLGGSAHDAALGAAADPTGALVVAGETASPNFPVASAPYPSPRGGVDGFVTRLGPSGAILASTYLGGGSDDRIRAVAVGVDGKVHLTGATSSSNFPATTPYPTLRGGMDGFYTRLNAALSVAEASTYLGGSGGSSLREEGGYGIAVDDQGKVWIAGATSSTDFPATQGGPFQFYAGGLTDGFIAVFTSSGSHLWSSYLGGSGLDAAMSVSASGSGVTVGGYTTSPNLPTIAPFQPNRAGEYDAFLASFSTSTATPVFLTYLGGSGSDSALAVSVWNEGVAVGGVTQSGNFPLTQELQPSNAGAYGGFATRFSSGLGSVAVTPISGSGAASTFSLSVPHGAGGSSVAWVQVLLNTSLSFAGGCYINYDRQTNTGGLLRDSDSNWLTFTPGANTTVSNGKCTINAAGVQVSVSPSGLGLTIPLQFGAAMTGTQFVYANAGAVGGAQTGWRQTGSWSVPAVQSPPTISSLTPSSGNGSTAPFVFQASDANGHADVRSLLVIINSNLDGNGGCYFFFNRTENRAALYRDSDGQWLFVAAGSSAVVENTRCSLSGSGLAAAGSGNVFQLAVPVTFKPLFAGPKSVFAMAVDTASANSGWVTAGSWTVPSAPAGSPPTFQSLAPTSGTSSSAQLAVQFSDANGHADIRSLIVVINSSLNGNNGCYFYLNRAENRVALFRDSDAQWPALTPGTAATIENTKCALSGAGITVTGSGNILQFSVPVTFKPEFAGPRTIYAVAVDAAGTDSGWISAGSWTVPSGSTPAPPVLQSVSPASGGGSGATFTFQASDANGQADIRNLVVVINGNLDGNSGCYFFFHRTENRVYLYRETDAQWLSLVPGAASTVEGSKCGIAGSGLQVSGTGNVAQFAVPILFKAGFGGNRTIFALAQDAGGADSGWVSAGSWIVP